MSSQVTHFLTLPEFFYLARCLQYIHVSLFGVVLMWGFCMSSLFPFCPSLCQILHFIIVQSTQWKGITSSALFGLFILNSKNRFCRLFSYLWYLYLFAPPLHKVTDTFLLWLFNTIPRGKGKVLFVKYFILPCVINRHHFQGFFICLLVCFIFCLMAILLGIPSKALILHCYPESRLSSMSFCSNMQMASMQRPSQ